MRVRCIENDPTCRFGDPLLDAALDRALEGQAPDAELPLSTGCEYLVFAIARSDDGVAYYYVLDDAHDNYPMARPAAFFEIVDERAWSCWAETPLPSTDGVSTAPRAWLHDENFYQSLVAEDPFVLATWAKVRASIESEDATHRPSSRRATR